MTMEFPYEAYKLTATFQVKKVVVTSYAGAFGETFTLESGGSIHWKHLHASVSDAIEAGRKAIAKQRANIEKLTKNVERREKNLNRAKA